MATGQTLLDTMELLNNELQLQSGEADVTRALTALNRAQDYFETLASQEKELAGDSTGTIVTAASTETTAYPTGLLRLDRLQLISDSTSRPESDILPTYRTGGGGRYAWPYLATTTSSGKPRTYWDDGRNIYWSPVPDAVYTIRWYGFLSATDISAAGTFQYPDGCILPFASFATMLMKIGVGDDGGDVSSVANATLRPALKTLARSNRDGARSFEYSRVHTT